MAAFAVLTVVAGIAYAGREGNPSLSADSLPMLVAAPVTLLSGAALLLGILGMAGEFRHQTVTQTFLVTPDRGRVVAAKLVAYPLAGIALALTILAFTAAVATGWLAAKGITPSLFNARLGRVLLGAVLAAGLCGLVGVGVAALVRNQVAALVGVAVWVLLIEGLLMSLLQCPQPGQVAALGGRGRPHQPRRRPALPLGRNPAAGRLRAGVGAGRDPAGRPPRHHLTAIGRAPPTPCERRRPGAPILQGGRSSWHRSRHGERWPAHCCCWRWCWPPRAPRPLLGQPPPPPTRPTTASRSTPTGSRPVPRPCCPPARSADSCAGSWHQLAGEAATLTEAEVRAHFSAEFLTVMFPPEVVIQFFQQNLAERGPFTFIGFAYPPRARQALALVQTATGERGALPIGVTSGRPALIEFLDLQRGPTRGRAQGTALGLVRYRGAAAVPALCRPWQPHGGVRGRADPRLVPAAESGRPVHPGVQLRPSQSGPWSRSDPAPTPRTARDFVADLHALLGVAHVPGPYVLAGHSNSGLYSQLYASTHPRQVAGLVLIDAVHPAYHKRQLAMLKPLLPSRGVGGPTPGVDDPAAPAGGPPSGSTSGPANARPGWRCDAPRCGRCRWLCSLTAGSTPRRRAGRPTRSSGCGSSCNASWPSWSPEAGW